LDLNNHLYISIREIYLRRKFNNNFTYVGQSSWILNKAYDLVPIFNIFTKLFHLSIHGKILISSLICICLLKHVLVFLIYFQKNLTFIMEWAKGVPCLLFNLVYLLTMFYINVMNLVTLLEIKEKSVVEVYLLQVKRNMTSLLCHVFKWLDKNEISFGINKICNCTIMVIKTS